MATRRSLPARTFPAWRSTFGELNGSVQKSRSSCCASSFAFSSFCRLVRAGVSASSILATSFSRSPLIWFARLRTGFEQETALAFFEEGPVSSYSTGREMLGGNATKPHDAWEPIGAVCRREGNVRTDEFTAKLWSGAS